MDRSLNSYRGSKPYLFVSYSLENKDIVHPELARLNRLGFRIWHEGGVSPGEEPGHEIEEAIKNCTQFVVLVTKKYAQYKLARKQISLATKCNIPILTIFLEDAKLTHGLDLHIGDLQSLKQFQLSGSQFEGSLLEALDSSAGTAEHSQETPGKTIAVEPSSRKWPKRAVKGIAAVVGFVAALITIYLFMQEKVNLSDQDMFIQEKVNLADQVDDLTFASHLTFMDAYSKSTMVQTEIARLINEAVVDGMSRASNTYPKLKNDERWHTIANTDANVSKLVNFIFDKDMTADEKIGGILREMMAPNKVDVIVSGQYIDEASKSKISIRPFIIVKDGKKLVTRNLQFSREELLCEDPNNASKKVLCQNSHDEIAQAVEELLLDLAELTFASHLSFMDAQTKSTIVQTDVALLINEAVVEGMSRASNANPKLKNDEPRHTIANTDANVNKLVNFIFDPVMTADEKIAGILREMMTPNKVDVIVSGQYIDEAGKSKISVRPFIIVKDGKKLVTRSLQFSREELLCEDPNNASKKVLCKNSHGAIAQAVKDLLESM